MEDGGPLKSTVLKHFAKGHEKAKDVTTLDWSGDGSQLATGSYDGLARIWSKDGKCVTCIPRNKRGYYNPTPSEIPGKRRVLLYLRLKCGFGG